MRDARWTLDRLWSGREQADQAYLAEIESKFSELVLSPDQAAQELSRIAETAGREFQAHVGVHLSALRHELSMDQVSFDALLRNITISVFDSNGGRHKFNLLEIVRGSRKLMRFVRWASEKIQRSPPPSIQQASILLGVAPASLPIAAAGTGKKVITAKLIAGGATLASVVVIAVVVGYEWYSHTGYVKEHRPRVREDISRAIREFTAYALSNHGQIGIGLSLTKTAIVEAIHTQETLWGRIKSRLQVL